MQFTTPVVVRLAHVLVEKGVAMVEEDQLSYYVVPADSPVSKLEARQAFDGLTEQERLYAHCLCRASWEGAPICLLQTSPESAPVFLLLQLLFSRQGVTSLRETATSKCGLNSDQFNVSLSFTPNS